MKKLITLAVILFIISIVSAGDCKPGYERSGWFSNECVQADCETITHAHYSYVGDCVCGSSGSKDEKDSDPNKECYMPADFKSCPNCVYACVGIKESCPGEGDEWDDEAWEGSVDEDYEEEDLLDSFEDTSEEYYTEGIDIGESKDCPTLCKDMFGPYTKGVGTHPNCRCTCEKGYVPNEPQDYCVRDCNDYCEAKMGEYASGTGEFPYCSCDCERGFYEDENDWCVKSCDTICEEDHNAKGEVLEDGCTCDCEEPFVWNYAHTECVICNEDGRCDSGRGERCNTCSDCNCEEPFSECNPDPSNPKAPLGYEGNDGCYVPDVEAYKEEECEKQKKATQKHIATMIDFGKWAVSHRTAWPGSPYDITDPNIGLNTDIGKMLIKLGYIYPDGRESGLRLVTNPMYAMESYADSHINMYEEYCGKKFNPHKTGQQIIEDIIESMPDKTGAYIPGTGTYSGNSPAAVLTHRGIRIFRSEYVITIESDGTETIEMTKGSVEGYNFDTEDSFKAEKGETIVIPPNQAAELPYPTGGYKDEFDWMEDDWWDYPKGRILLIGVASISIILSLMPFVLVIVLIVWAVKRKKKNKKRK